ncbi:MAG: ChaN family lipoprotein [Desulfovibrionales bacterium]
MKKSSLLALPAAALLLATFTFCSEAALRLFDVAARQETTLSQALPELQTLRILHVGELHDRPGHHRAQLEIIRALHDSATPVLVGLEMFEQRNQDALDAWVSRSLSEEEFLPHFRSNWGESWPLYRDIFDYCRSQGIPMVGLNVPRAIVSQVAREGFESLTEEQVGQLPPVSCNVAPEYMELLRSSYGHHGSDQSFVNFCEAQVVWDTAMAYYALERLEKHPRAVMVVLAGAIHAWRPGIPTRVQIQAPGTPQRVILPETREIDRDSVSLQDCDYLFFPR